MKWFANEIPKPTTRSNHLSWKIWYRGNLDLQILNENPRLPYKQRLKGKDKWHG
jgi:hypothetical protein